MIWSKADTIDWDLRCVQLNDLLYGFIGWIMGTYLEFILDYYLNWWLDLQIVSQFMYTNQQFKTISANGRLEAHGEFAQDQLASLGKWDWLRQQKCKQPVNILPELNTTRKLGRW